MNINQMRKPDFIIVGAAKSGTTSLYAFLKQHSKVVLVSDRLEYFGEYENPAVRVHSRRDYLQLFEPYGKDVVVGEKSVSYLYSEAARNEIYECNPNAKIIIILRDPVERAYSDYWHRRRTRVESLDFEAALSAENDRIAKGARFELHYANYGKYYSKVKGFIDLFGKRQVLILRYEELKEDAGKIVSLCEEFLDVGNKLNIDSTEIHNRGSVGGKGLLLFFLKEMYKHKFIVNCVNFLVPDFLKRKVTGWMQAKNETKSYPKMNDRTYRYLRQYFHDDVELLEDLLGWDLSDWKS